MLDDLLTFHQPLDRREAGALAEMQAFAHSLDRPLWRGQWPAHFTGSALVVDAAGGRVCLVLHRKLNRWLQPGGHAEEADEGDLARTALREAREETGLVVSLHPSASRPFDLDVHVIPARGEEPEHQHLDVRFLVVAEPAGELVHDPAESHDAQWHTWAEALARADEPALVRLLQKARTWVEDRHPT
jgi:8-oxo-dGTP pyrophosphatase MutT (NUDIX family)